MFFFSGITHKNKIECIQVWRANRRGKKAKSTANDIRSVARKHSNNNNTWQMKKINAKNETIIFVP
jgi:hypothetical protein